jgi:hypothetical protein
LYYENQISQIESELPHRVQEDPGSRRAGSLQLTAQQFTHENVDLGVLNEIKWQAFNNSQVMDHLFYLSEAYGPRVTTLDAGSGEFNEG